MANSVNDESVYNSVEDTKYQAHLTRVMDVFVAVILVMGSDSHCIERFCLTVRPILGLTV